MNNDFRSVLLSVVESGEASDVIKQIYEDVFSGTFVDLCMYDLTEEVLDESSANYSNPRMVKEKYGDGVSVMFGDVEYRYISDEYTSSDLLKKLEGIMRHQSAGQIKKWLDRHAIKYWDSKKGDVPATQETPKKSLETEDGVEGDKFILVINGKKYSYESDDFSADELKTKYEGIAKHNKGRAIAWLKKNCKPATRINESGFSEVVDPEEELSESLKEGSIITVDGNEFLVEGCKGSDVYVIDSEDKRFVLDIYETAEVEIYEAAVENMTTHVRDTMIRKWISGKGGLSDSQWQRMAESLSKKYGWTLDQLYDEFHRQMDLLMNIYEKDKVKYNTLKKAAEGGKQFLFESEE